MKTKSLTLNKKDPARIVFLVLGLFLVISYRILIHAGLAGKMYRNFARPVHDLLSGICDKTSVCVGEILIGAAFVILIVDIILELVNITKHFFRTILSVVLIICSFAVFVYGGFCFMWGFYYAAPGVSEICGIETDGILHEELVAADEYFLELANEYSKYVERDDDGNFVYTEESFARSTELYDKVCGKWPGLKADPRHPKKVFFSKFVSMLDFTGFFFPFTGEACINNDSPDCMKPVTVAHELAHQRGIAKEDEANFIGVVASLYDGSPDYVYSASLLALSHLQSAMRKSGDTDTWQRIRDSYGPEVEHDLVLNSEYWSKYRKNPVNKATTKTYDAFLKSYDQPLGRETYGACVDLLAYYVHYMVE